MERAASHHDTCSYCAATETRRLGHVLRSARSTVCEQCGNLQFVDGVRKPTHDECLHKDDGGFKMIKFIR